jgi:hypothetical protein
LVLGATWRIPCPADGQGAPFWWQRVQGQFWSDPHCLRIAIYVRRVINLHFR